VTNALFLILYVNYARNIRQNPAKKTCPQQMHWNDKGWPLLPRPHPENA
jgi:hypothetical protein